MSDRCVDVQGASIHYQVGGRGQPIVLIHGLAGSTRWWGRNVEALSQSFRVYSIDLIGFGRSRGARRFVLTEAARHLAAWMDRLDLGRASIVGHSMGGFIAAHLAADHPDRVARLVLVDSIGLPFDLNRLQHAIGLARALRYVPPLFLLVLTGDVLRAGPVTVWSAAREVLSSDLTRELSRIRAPTLVLWGERDSVVPLELGKRFADHISDLRFAVIPEAGHNPMWDRPADFNRRVLEFLAD